MNKTTNERFAKRAATAVSTDSKTSSMLSINTSIDEYNMNQRC